MTILSIAYELCKTVLHSSLKKDVTKIMSEIHENNIPTDTGQGSKFEFGKTIRNQSAQKANIQFYGYLVANNKRADIEKQFNCVVPKLSSHQIDILTRLHQEILNLNNLIINLIPNNLIHKKVMSPYSLYDKLVEIDDNFKSSIFSDVQLERLKNEFRKHQSIAEIGKIPLNLYPDLNTITNKKINEALYFFTNKLYKAGVMNYPQDLNDAIKTAKRNKTTVPVKYIFSLMNLRESIDILNQLIYQAFLLDKLPVYDENNLISIESTSHLISKGISLKALVTHNPRPKDLVHVINPYDDGDLPPTLCQVEGCTTSFKNEFGSYEDLKLRVINEDLIPFPGITDFSSFL